MRVLIVTNTYPPADISGVGTLVAELARELDRRGHPVAVLCRRAAPEDRLARPIGGPKLLFPLLAALAVRRVGGLRGWDVLHLHESDGVLVGLRARLARAFGRPAPRIAATLQVSYREERLAVRTLRDEDGAVVSRPTRSERLFAWLRAPLLALLGRLTAASADLVIAPSRRTAVELQRDYRVAEVEVIPNGILPPPIPANRTHQPGSPRRILYAGRLRTRKAVAVLVEAIARLPPGEAKLVLAGAGEQRPALEAQIERLGIGAAVEWLGSQSPAAMERHYHEADLFCLPSTYEGLPLAILEAMGHGLPVVATAVSGNPDAVADGESGLLVPPNDVAALARALAELLADPRRAAAMGEAGRQRVATRFSIETVCGSYLAAWQHLAGDRSAET